MPYIQQHERGSFYDYHTGNLNYAIHEVLKTYMDVHGLNYSTINDVIGALECTKQEFYRRVAIPYEEHKKDENGDIPLYIEYGK